MTVEQISTFEMCWRAKAKDLKSEPHEFLKSQIVAKYPMQIDQGADFREFLPGRGKDALRPAH